MNSKGRRGGEDSVLGLDNVSIDISTAGVGTRLLAATIDYLIMTLLLIVVMIAAAILGAVTDNAWVIFATYLVGSFLINWGYFTIAEIATAGQTPGKRLFKLRTVTAEAGLPTNGALAIRNLIRIVDNFIGVPLMAVDPMARRLGDRLAGTLVIHDSTAEDENLILSRIPRGWGHTEVAMVEAFFDRRESLDTDRQQELARRIVALIERDDPEFLQSIDRTTTPSGVLWRAFRPDWI